ncbi:MAG: LacI family DNA-binding transcriptional regulator [Capsulimonadaceae bacterium]|nr:LacI family DNA-binding transcriptional regulator [Capsulimonadaceae bacterium]
MIAPPSIQLLERIVDDNGSSSDGQHLYEVVESALTDLIDKHFVDGQRFWPETAVCEQLNVSRVTVRHALNALTEQGRISRHRKRGTFVRKSVQERAQVAVCERSFRSIGVYVRHSGSPFWSEAIDELALAAVESGRTLHVYSRDRGEAAAAAVAQLTTSPDEEAILLLGDTHDVTDELYTILTRRGYRVVTVDMPICGYPAPFVGVDNTMGVYMGMQHLIELGHCRITMLNYEPPLFVNTQLRVNAFRTVAALHNLTEARVFSADLTLPGGRHRIVATAMEQIWSNPGERPTAIFCDSGGCAVSAVKWCAEQGVQLPRELSLLSFDDTREVRFSRPPLSCIAQPFAPMARRALELLERPQNEHVLLPPALIVRSSTAAPGG